MQQRYLLLLTGLLFAGSAQAGTCIDLKTCSTLMHEITGQRYIWGSLPENTKMGAAPDVELTKETAELVFTALLDQSGFARAPVGDGKTFRIVRAAERKEMEVPIVEASADSAPALANTWDWVMMRYKLRSPELAEYLEKSFRLHVPREARMQANENVGEIIVTASTPVVRQMYATLKGADKPLTPAIKEKMKLQEKNWHELELAKQKNKKQD